MPTPLRLMAILAHPDDESLGFGGTIARYVAEGAEVTVITATRGDAGRFRGERDGPNHPGPEGLARIREAELRAAVQVLGVKELVQLGYRDGALDQVDSREAVSRIAACIRSAKPQVVITFAQDGSYGHPDHIAISQMAGAAIVAAADAGYVFVGDPPSHPPHAVAKFYYIAWNAAAWDVYQAVFKKLVSTVDGVERQASPWPDWSITTAVDTSAHWETVWKAVSCHDSQIAGYEKLKNLSPENHAALWGTQTYYRVFSTVNGGRGKETDLFEGLRG